MGQTPREDTNDGNNNRNVDQIKDSLVLDMCQEWTSQFFSQYQHLSYTITNYWKDQEQGGKMM